MADERFGRSKSMDKRLAAQRVALTVEEILDSYVMHFDQVARKHGSAATFTHDELAELHEQASAAMKDTLGHG